MTIIITIHVCGIMREDLHLFSAGIFKLCYTGYEIPQIQLTVVK